MGSSARDILNEIENRHREQNLDRVASATHDLAAAGCDYATAISPVGEDAHAGTFKDGWHVVDYPPRRAGDAPMSQIRNDTQGAVSIEYGTKTTPPHHTLTSTKVFVDQLSSRDIHI